MTECEWEDCATFGFCKSILAYTQLMYRSHTSGCPIPKHLKPWYGMLKAFYYLAFNAASVGIMVLVGSNMTRGRTEPGFNENLQRGELSSLAMHDDRKTDDAARTVAILLMLALVTDQDIEGFMTGKLPEMHTIK